MAAIIKRGTSYFPGQHSCIKGLLNEWENHPSLIAGVEALDAYQTWVSAVVLPIAFQWIEEHYDEVYAKVPVELKDDVGVVIAVAFQLVKQTPAYQEGLEKLEAYKKEKKEGKLKPSDINPIWTKITKDVRGATEKIFQAEKKYLDDTI